MGSFSTLSTGETAGGGNESFYGDVSNGTRNTSHLHRKVQGCTACQCQVSCEIYD